MARSHTRLTPLAALLVLVLACGAAPGGGGGAGSGGNAGTGGATTASGGTASSGGSATGGSSTGGVSAGGSSSGGDGTGTGGDGLGGETATGGTDAAGGSSGGSGGSTVGYAVCDGDLGMEDNPGCADGELCVENACTELCPLNDEEAALEYECPVSPAPAEAMSRCQTFIGRCILHCALQGGPTYSCPDGMVCVGEACGWPD